MELECSGLIVYWRGPAPWYFMRVPPDLCVALRAVSGTVSYGWGMIPVTAQIGRTKWTTALFPKDGVYMAPIKASVRAAEGLDEGDVVTIHLITG